MAILIESLDQYKKAKDVTTVIDELNVREDKRADKFESAAQVIATKGDARISYINSGSLIVFPTLIATHAQALYPIGLMQLEKTVLNGVSVFFCWKCQGT